MQTSPDYRGVAPYLYWLLFRPHYTRTLEHYAFLQYITQPQRYFRVMPCNWKGFFELWCFGVSSTLYFCP